MELNYRELIYDERCNFIERNGLEPDSVIIPHFVYTYLLESFTGFDSKPDPNCKIKFMGLNLIPNFDRDCIFKCIKTEL